METNIAVRHHEPWNKGKLTGQKAPLRLKDIWAIRVRLQLSNNPRDLALFNLAIDSKYQTYGRKGLIARDSRTHKNCLIPKTVLKSGTVFQFSRSIPKLSKTPKAVMAEEESGGFSAISDTGYLLK